MTVIPVGFAQSNLVFGGLSAPQGAEITMGHSLSAFTGDPTDAATAIRSAFVTEVMPALSNNLVLQTVRVKFGPEATGPSGEVPGSSGGGDGSDGASPAVSYLVRKLTAFGGRAGTGRMYVPGVVEDGVHVSGDLDIAKRTELQTAFSSYLLALGAAELDPVLLHGVGSPLVTPTTITALTVDAFVATQRRRQRR